MEYIGIQTQKRRNNVRSSVLLILFPLLLVGLTWLLFFLLVMFSASDPEAQGKTITVNEMFLNALPWVLGACAVWFLIAYFSNTAMIRSATSAHSLERKDNKRIYNLVENLCMSVGMPMPKLNVIEDDSLNAFASGINKSTYTVTLSRGIINKLDDEELSGVIAHELTHIRNNDVRLLIVSIVFVGIFAFISEMLFRTLIHTPRKSSSSDNNKGGAIVAILIGLALAAIGYLLATMMRFAISRKREYMADAGAAEMTKNPLALASALQKISGDPYIEAVTREDVAQMFIEHTGVKKKKSVGSRLFATHPPIDDRIRVLQQF